MLLKTRQIPFYDTLLKVKLKYSNFLYCTIKKIIQSKRDEYKDMSETQFHHKKEEGQDSQPQTVTYRIVTSLRVGWCPEDHVQCIGCSTPTASAFCNIIGRNKPKNCIFTIPESLEKGTYKLIIKAPGYSDGELLTGRLKKPLTVK